MVAALRGALQLNASCGWGLVFVCVTSAILFPSTSRAFWPLPLAVRALIRHGAALDSVITPARVENSPIRCSVGSNVLHIAAVIGNVTMAKVILEAQVRPHDAAGGSAP